MGRSPSLVIFKILDLCDLQRHLEVGLKLRLFPSHAGQAEWRGQIIVPLATRGQSTAPDLLAVKSNSQSVELISFGLLGHPSDCLQNISMTVFLIRETRGVS